MSSEAGRLSGRPAIQFIENSKVAIPLFFCFLKDAKQAKSPGAVSQNQAIELCLFPLNLHNLWDNLRLSAGDEAENCGETGF